MSRTATGPRPVFVQLRIPGNDIMAHQTGGKRWPRTARIGLPARALGVLLQGAVRQAGGAPATALAAGAVVAAAFITAAWRRRDDDRASLTYLIAATLLLTPICWIFYLTLLLIPLCLYRPSLSVEWGLYLLFWTLPGETRIDSTLATIALSSVLVWLLVPHARPRFRPLPA